MKKLVIAGASVALAAMPVLGAFAVTGSAEFTDNLSVEVTGGCTMENGGNSDGVYTNRSFSGQVATGNTVILSGSSATDSAVITIKCNTTSGTVTVTSAGSVALTGTTSSGNTIAAGAQTSGSTSGWAIKSNAVNASTDPYANYKAHEVGTFLTATASASGTTFNPSYQVYAAAGQAPDTYTGSVTYTIGYTGA